MGFWSSCAELGEFSSAAASAAVLRKFTMIWIVNHTGFDPETMFTKVEIF